MIAFAVDVVNPGSLLRMPQGRPAPVAAPELTMAAKCQLATLMRSDERCVTASEDYVTCRAQAELVAHRFATVRADRLSITERGREAFAVISERASGLRLLAGESLEEQIAAVERRMGEVRHG